MGNETARKSFETIAIIKLIVKYKIKYRFSLLNHVNKLLLEIKLTFLSVNNFIELIMLIKIRSII